MILYSVYFYIYRLAQAVQGQNYGLDDKGRDVRFAAEKEILVFSAPTTWDLELVQSPMKRILGTILEGKSGWAYKPAGDSPPPPLGSRIIKCGGTTPPSIHLHWAVLN
jgi:hypothetical protein